MDKAFTERVISLTIAGSPWYEYCPSTETEIKQTFSAIVSDEPVSNKKLRVYAINVVIKRDKLPLNQISENATTDAWVHIYWELYQRNYILLGYSKNKAVGCQIFSIKESNRQNIKVH